jgi:cation diffusion facilitator CzcD-associated flavoprotein CzcO
MPVLRWAALLVISLALSGCCTFGDMCSSMAPPTSGPAMAWDGAGQPPDQKIASARHPHHVEDEIVTGSLNPIAPASTAEASAAPDETEASRDETAAAEMELKQKLVICRGCLSEPPVPPIAIAGSDRQMTASASP